MGIVYVITNPEMPGLVKIGHTSQTIEQRLRDLDKTGVPVPFECVAAWEFEDAPGVENTLHQAFADRRVRQSREFFRVSPGQPIAILERFGAKDILLIHESPLTDALFLLVSKSDEVTTT